MRRRLPSEKRRGRFAVGPDEADSDIENALAYSTDSGAEENEDPIIGQLGNSERKRVRELLRRYARGDVQGRGTVGANEDDGDDSDGWVVDDQNKNVRFNGRGEVEVYGSHSLATGPFGAPRKSASRWHAVRPFAQTQPVSSSSLGALQQPTVARKTSSTSNPRQGTNARGHRANTIPEQQTFASQQQPPQKFFPFKSAPSIGSHADEHTAREKITSSSHPRPNPTEGNITRFDETGDIPAQIEGRESGKSGDNTRLFSYSNSEEDGDLNEIPGRTMHQVQGAQSQASLGQSSLPEQEFGADIQRAIELSLRETDPVASPPLPQTTLPQSSVPGPSLTPAAGLPMFGPWQNFSKQYYSRHPIHTERLAPPVRRTTTENDTRASLRAWDRGTGGDKAAGDEPIGPRNTLERNSKRRRAIYEDGTGDTTEDDDCIPSKTQDRMIKRVRGSNRRTPEDDTNKDEHFGHKDFQSSESKRTRVTIEHASENTTEDDEPFGQENTKSRPVTGLAGRRRRTRHTACDKCRKNKRRCTHARSDQNSLEPENKDTGRRAHPACAECRKAHRGCIHAKSEREPLRAEVQKTGREIGGKDGLNQTAKVRGRETEHASLESRDSSGDTTEIDESFRTMKVRKKTTNTHERGRAARKNRVSSGVITGNDQPERLKEIKKTKKTVQAAKASCGDDQKAEEIPVLYPAGQPPPKVTATRTEIRTEAFQKTLREEAGRVHHTYDPAKTNPIDRHYRSITSMSTHPTNMPPGLMRALAERVRSPPPPPPQAQVQPPQARPRESAFQRTARLLELASAQRSECRQQPIRPQIAHGAVRREEMANTDNQRTRQVIEPRVRNEAIEGVERRAPRTGSATQETEEQMERDPPADYWSRIAEEDPYARYQ
ncbi:MAG: hypothetical protein M1835_007626 [Candelina submexicana]|nr:MAG: hypothetical protein M1835_007626 [Candelina submexicana]